VGLRGVTTGPGGLPRTPTAGAGRDAASEVWEEVFRRDYASLVRAAWLLSGSREVAEDVVQDVFIKVMAADAIPADAGRYVRQAAVNRVRTWQRRQILERRHHAPAPPAQVIPEVYGLWVFLQTLSGRQRAAIVLRYYCDLPLTEVAQLMGCRTGTVSVLIRRALQRARRTKEVFEQ
jgi:DNA-directed RNA polymerase specialized sigma24 family protein